MKRFAMAGLVVLLASPWASAQYVYGPPRVFAPGPVFGPPPTIAPVVSYSYYPPAAPVYAPPVYAPAPVYTPPVTAYYGPAPVAAPYGYGYSATTTYGLGIFRPRGVTTQYYYGPYYR